MRTKLEILGSTGLEITADHFGANYLTHIDDVNDGKFADTLDELSISALRFPGGGVVEDAFDVTDWDATHSDSLEEVTLTPTSEYLAFIAEHGLTTTFVLPTRNLLLGELDASNGEPRFLDYDRIEATVEFVRKLFSKSDNDLTKADIVALEIGNEYWGSGRMTTLEYGNVANELVIQIDELFEGLITGDDVADGFVRPKLLVQMGQSWGADFRDGGYLHAPPDSDESWTWGEKVEMSNKIVIDALEPEARQAIDGVIKHFYYKDPHTEDAKFSGEADESSFINKNFKVWEGAGGFEDLEIHITEWNVWKSNVGQLGLSAASTNLQQLENMLRAGVDAAQIWSLQHNTSTNLYKNGLTVQGAVFDLMAEVLPGATLLEDNLFGESFEVSAYQKGDTRHVFVTLREEHDELLELDLSELLPDGATVTATLVGVDMETSDGEHYLSKYGRLETEYYHEHDTRPLISDFDSEELLSSDGVVTIGLKPYEVMRIDITYNGGPLVSDDPLFGGAGTEEAQGETIHGGNGADQIIGSDQNDTIYGGFSVNDLRDVIYAGKGNDYVDGGYGNDAIYGGDGDDILLGGFGSDLLAGQNGNDVITGSALSDLIFGNDGDDFLNGGFGHDRINGGSGADKFYHLGIPDHGSDWIQDFTAEDGDVLLFADDGASASDFRVNFAETANAGQAGIREAFVIYEPSGQIVWALVDGEAQEALMIQFGARLRTH